MEAIALTTVLATIVGWCVLAGRLQEAGLTAPIVFVAAGWMFAEGLDLFDLEVEPELVKVIAEVTLVWVLFADASRVRLEPVPRDLGMYVRLLGVGLPLTVALGTGAAMVVLGLRPVGGAPGRCGARPDRRRARCAGDVEPPRPRQGAQRAQRRERAQRRHRHPDRAGGHRRGRGGRGDRRCREPGPRGPVAAGRAWWRASSSAGVGGMVTRLARERGWLSEELAGPAVLALALLAYTGALLVDGNGFVAAFVGGLVFGERRGPRR